MNTTIFLQQFGPIILIFAIFYFMIIRPQQKREKERRNMLDSLKEGDEIITIGGIFGRILNIKDDVVTLEVGDKVKIKVTRSAIGNVIKRAEKEK
ncbi:preprotein translocase subunit YajC [Thermosediminibacter oceani]|uniref:Protein translocase subunit yajC n=1 Tax=Thermosediminibacter oceani (strain ATCC BAA-1034 / DSM 16646 / JW/IW-1228P) TaxID=555079 RepID=D9RXQ5_THEOJ|nr:preprotein translocase subunit YajC [Thermosediminibacter oceani]ADL08129.1 protein translocase subunit yajC [Thermosediminibacter oceani DSM 16646]